MSTSDHDNHAEEGSAAGSHVQVAVWFSTKARPVSEEFAIEIVGQESWKPTPDAWEVKHIFDGLVPGEPYVLRVDGVDPDAEPIEIRFWAAPHRESPLEFPDYLFDVRDDDMLLRYPGFKSTERTYPRTRPVSPLSMSRLKRLLPARWGSGALFGVVIGLSVLLYLWSAFNDDDTPLARSGLPSESLHVTFRATRLEGSDEMLVSFENDSGGTEEHVILDETWEIDRTTSSYDSLWMDVQNLSDDGAVRCELLVNGEPWVEATSSGPRVKAHCYGYPSQTVE